MRPFLHRLSTRRGSTKRQSKNNDHERLELTIAGEPEVLVLGVPLSTVGMIEMSETVQNIEHSIQGYMEGVPWLMKALDDVARLHPFVGVAVIAFKAAYTLEVSRRENDNRIKLLYIEMKDMIAVLVEMRNIRDPDLHGSHGASFKGRMQTLAEKVAQDIKECANTCDTYSRKNLLVKVVNSLAWKEKLLAYVQLFTDNRAQFQFALTAHAARSIDNVDHKIDKLDAKMDLMVKIFDKLSSENERELETKVEEKGGKNNVIADDQALRELTAGDATAPFTLDILKNELRQDIQEAIMSNMKNFESKYELRQKQVDAQLRQYIHEENNRVIKYVTEGPYQKVKDPVLRDIWKDMHWGGNVEARAFVLTLRDYFKEKVESGKTTQPEDESNPINNNDVDDDWALEYLGITWLQPVMDAFDDDASGYVSIAEVNRFTDMRPAELNWSLPHWIAYWAIGWQLAATAYKDRIQTIFRQMFQMLPRLLPENRPYGDKYLSEVWSGTIKLTMALYPRYSHRSGRFQSYVDSVEERIRINLEDIGYRIDALDSVHLVLGHNRIEHHVFPLLFLLLKRDLNKFSLAQSLVLHEDELVDSSNSLTCITQAMDVRYRELQDLWTAQNSDAKQQFETAAGGVFRYTYDSSDLWSSDFNDSWWIEDEEATATVPAYVLKHQPINERPYGLTVFENPAEMMLEVPEDTQRHTLYRNWHGFVYRETAYPDDTMHGIQIRSTDQPNRDFEGSGKFDGGLDYRISGRAIKAEADVVHVTFTLDGEDSNGRSYWTTYFCGRLDSSGSLVGTSGWDEDPTTHQTRFILKSIPAEFMCLRPLVSEFTTDKKRALWKFALLASRYQARRNLWSWSFFRNWRDIRERYIHLEIRRSYYGPPLTSDETREYQQHMQLLTPSYAALCDTLIKRRVRMMPRHSSSICCANCDSRLGGSRIICLDCNWPPSGEFWSSFNLCDHNLCRNYLGMSHVREHDLLKLRRILHRRDVTRVVASARNALFRCRSFFSFTAGDKMLINKPLNQDTPSIPDEHANETAPENAASESEQVSADASPSSGDEPPTPSADFPIAGDAIQSKDNAILVASCAVCQKDLRMGGCWYCVDCSDNIKDYFVCDDCDSRFLLSCTLCKQPYAQPTWYYGSGPNDNFMCNKCIARGCQPLDDLNKEGQHTTTHALVRCKESIAPSAIVSAEEQPEIVTAPSTEDRMQALNAKTAELEEKIVKIQESLHDVQTYTKESMLKIEDTLSAILGELRASSSSDSTVRTLVAVKTNGESI